MHNLEITRQVQRLRSLISRTATATAGDIELQAEWARYICVVAAGLLENALRAIYSDYVERAASPAVAAYAKANLSRVQNPRADKFLDISGTFNDDWRDELGEYLEQRGGKDAINSIMTNRHLIAHGKTSNISMVPLTDYINKSIKVLEFIEHQCRR